jgi:uncharacterized protein
MRRVIVLIGLMLFAPAAFAQDGDPDYFRITGVKKDDNINVRRQPNADARIVGKIPKDADGVKNLGCNRGGLSEKQWEKASAARKKEAQRKRWCQVEYNDVKGWVSGRFLAEGQGAPKQQAPQMAPAPQMTPPAQAIKPSFDCEKAEKNAEKLICADVELASVDRELARVYKIASDAVNATPEFTELLDSQRAWLAQRNTCFDKECVAEISVRRIHQLRQAYAEARQQNNSGISMGPVSVRCDGLQALIGVTFVNSEPGYAYLEWTDRYLVLPNVPAGSGSKFEGSFASFTTQGDNALLTLPGGKEMKCKVEKVG